MGFNELILKEGLDQALAIARQRAETLDRLRQALLDDDEAKIRFYASQLCGLNYESDRIPESVNT